MRVLSRLEMALTCAIGLAFTITVRAGSGPGEAVGRLTAEPFSSGTVSVLAVTLSGDTLACINPSVKLVPASNVKLVTTGSALVALGSDYQFRTAISYSGRVNGPVLEGDIYLVGDGDPTLGAKYSSSRPLDSVLEFILAQLEEAGITSVRGAVVADGRCFSSVQPHWDWSAEDSGFYYGAEVKGLNFYENTIDYEVTPLQDGGVDVVRTYPADMPWLEFSSAVSSGPAGSGDRIQYYSSALTPSAVMCGSIGADRGLTREHCVNGFPEYTFASIVYDYFREHGIDVTDGYADVGPDGYLRRFPETGRKKAADVRDLVTMGRLSSPELGVIIRETNQESDNFYAEALLKAIGLYYMESGEVSDCLSAESAVLTGKLGMGPGSLQSGGFTGAKIVDGCGLSRKNYVSSAFLVRFLTAMTLTPEFPVYLRSLPQPGSGTLYSRLRTSPQDLRSRIYMKSGSMDGVRCFSGYILPAGADPDSLPGDTVVFSILTNNVTAPSSQVYSAIDAVIAALAD